jgi:hypothetical protein
MDKGRKRVLGYRWHSGRPAPPGPARICSTTLRARTGSLVASAVQSAERIMRKVDNLTASK